MKIVDVLNVTKGIRDKLAAKKGKANKFEKAAVLAALALVIVIGSVLTVAIATGLIATVVLRRI